MSKLRVCIYHAKIGRKFDLSEGFAGLFQMGVTEMGFAEHFGHDLVFLHRCNIISLKNKEEGSFYPKENFQNRNEGVELQL